MAEPFVCGFVYRAMIPGEEAAVYALVSDCFMQFVAPDYRPEGIEAVLEYASPKRMAERVEFDGFVLVAEREGRLAGMIEMREDRHVALLFVAPVYHRQGIARELLRQAIALCLQRLPELRRVTVNSSPYALHIYERLGFRATGPVEERNGIRYTPMVLELPQRPYIGEEASGTPT